ncbi:allatostatin-A receptor-like [Asterias amurensis]|uniref:allatostatin-A receptor-like n=1 Tax=Asterias amurensis TaxID=7602 RepID=UPI003AB3FA1A
MDQLLFPTASSTTEEILDKVAEDIGVFTKFVLAFYGIICVVGITGNLLVVIVLLRVPSLRSNTSDFLVHLSIVDALTCVFVIPYYLVPQTSSSSNPGFFDEFWCRFYTSQFLFWCLAVTSALSLITVNLERYVAIVHPHKYKTVFSKRNKYLMIAAWWILALITKCFNFFVYGDGGTGCTFSGWPNRGFQIAFGFYTFSVNFFVPFVVMVFAQRRVISSLRSQVMRLYVRSAFMNANLRDQREMWQLRASQTLVKTLLACVMTFAVCWAPNQIWFLLFNCGVPFKIGAPDHDITIILAVGNSCVNPVIYTMMNKPFRKGIREVFCKQRDSNQVGDNNGAHGRDYDI